MGRIRDDLLLFLLVLLSAPVLLTLLVWLLQGHRAKKMDGGQKQAGGWLIVRRSEVQVTTCGT